MKKLRLSVESLRVDGFEVLAREAAPEGTVMGRDGGMATNPRCSQFSDCYASTCGSGSCETGNPCIVCATVTNSPACA